MLTDKFMHIHVPRTGGSTLRGLIISIPGVRLLDAAPHASYRYMAAKAEQAGIAPPPAFVFVRNPWEWYVSQWSWVCHIGKHGHQGASFEEYMDVVKENEAVDGPSGVVLNLSTLSCAWRWLEVDRAQYVGRFERFGDEVVRILLAIVPGLVTEEGLRARLGEVGHYRRRRDFYGDWRQYYTGEIKDWVALWDAGVIERFGYAFGEHGDD